MNNTTEPNIYVLSKEIKGVKHYFSHIDKLFYSNLTNASGFNEKRIANDWNVKGFLNANLEIIKESEFINAKNDAMTKIMIMASSLAYHIEQIQPFLPNKSQASKGMHKHLKNTAICLVPYLSDYREFSNIQEDAVDYVETYYGAFVAQVAKIPLNNIDHISYILEAYNSEPNSILGITKKILKKKNTKCQIMESFLEE